jgi:hypothetical protein
MAPKSRYGTVPFYHYLIFSVFSSEDKQATVSKNRRAPVYFCSLLVLHTRYVESIEIYLRYRTRHANITPIMLVMLTSLQ